MLIPSQKHSVLWETEEGDRSRVLRSFYAVARRKCRNCLREQSLTGSVQHATHDTTRRPRNPMSHA